MVSLTTGCFQLGEFFYLTLLPEHSLVVCLLGEQKYLMNFSAAQFSGPAREKRMEWSRCVILVVIVEDKCPFIF